jgi:hypothetical protein
MKLLSAPMLSIALIHMRLLACPVNFCQIVAPEVGLEKGGAGRPMSVSFQSRPSYTMQWSCRMYVCRYIHTYIRHGMWRRPSAVWPCDRS